MFDQQELSGFSEFLGWIGGIDPEVAKRGRYLYA